MIGVVAGPPGPVAAGARVEPVAAGDSVARMVSG